MSSLATNISLLRDFNLVMDRSTSAPAWPPHVCKISSRCNLDTRVSICSSVNASSTRTRTNLCRLGSSDRDSTSVSKNREAALPYPFRHTDSRLSDDEIAEWNFKKSEVNGE